MIRDRESRTLSERERSVLRVVVDEYVRLGAPVGSQRVAKIYRESLSSATLRNVMASLEELGYLSQPHTSAGRVPTAAAYRFYVEGLLENRCLSSKESGEIRKRLEAEIDPAELMSKASQILSAYSNNIGIVLSPPISQVCLKHVEFVRLSKRRVLVVLVSHSGLVRHRLIHLGRDFIQAELDQAGRYLVETFAGWSLLEIRRRLVSLVAEEKEAYDQLLKNAVVLGTQALTDEEEETSTESRVFLGGTSSLFERIDAPEFELLHALFRTLEQKTLLVEIINACLKGSADSPAVTIGLQDHIPELGNWALIVSPFNLDSQATGSLGILGPARMEYGHTISLVDYVAKLFGQIVRQG